MDRKGELGEWPTTHTVTDKKGKVKYRKEGGRRASPQRALWQRRKLL